MGDTVEFKKAFFRDSVLPQSLEDAMRLAAAYGGVHDFDFEDLIDEPFNDLGDWDQDPSGTFAISSNRLSATAGSGELWYQIKHSTQAYPGFVASFDLISGEGAFLFRGKSSASPDDCYVAWWTSNRIGISRVDFRTPTKLIDMPLTIAGPCRIQVHVRYSLDSVDDERKWLQACIFRDGNAMVAFAEDIGDTIYDWNGDYIGFAVKDSKTMVVDNFTVSALHRDVEWVTVDPGSAPGAGMGRAIGTTRIAYICRYDNTFRVWRPGNKSLDWTVYPAGRVKQADERKTTTTPTHARVQAAIHEADGYDNPGGEWRMHRFALHNDPNIMTEGEAYLESLRVLHDWKERAEVRRFEISPPCYQLEPHDRIVVDGVDYRIIGIQTNTTMTDQGPKYSQIVEAQQYLSLTEPSLADRTRSGVISPWEESRWRQ